MKNDSIVVRDLRTKSHFVMDDEYLNGYARVCGPFATVVYLCLCRHADYHTQRAFPSIQTIAEKMRISEDSVNRGLKILISYGIIAKERVRHPQSGRWVNNSYVLLDKSQWLQTDLPPHRSQRHGTIPPTAVHHTADSGSDHTADSGTKDSHIIKDSHKKDSHNAAQSAAGVNFMDSVQPKKGGRRNYDPTVHAVLGAFSEIDPKNKTYYGHRGQKTAAVFLVQEYGLQTVLDRIAVLSKTNAMPYFPTITTPVQLKEKWTMLEHAVIRQKAEGDRKKVKIV